MSSEGENKPVVEISEAKPEDKDNSENHQEANLPEEKLNEAATLIQSTFRGFITRKSLHGPHPKSTEQSHLEENKNPEADVDNNNVAKEEAVQEASSVDKVSDVSQVNAVQNLLAAIVKSELNEALTEENNSIIQTDYPLVRDEEFEKSLKMVLNQITENVASNQSEKSETNEFAVNATQEETAIIDTITKTINEISEEIKLNLSENENKAASGQKTPSENQIVSTSTNEDKQAGDAIVSTKITDDKNSSHANGSEN